MNVIAAASLAIAATMSESQEGATAKRWVLYQGQPGAIAMTLSAERSTYYLGEPVRLTVVIRNESDESLAGFFGVASGKAAVLYRRRGLPFMRFGSEPAETSRRQWRDELRAPAPLGPGQEAESGLKIAIHGDGRFVLEEPGEYEFKVVSHPAPEDPELAVESNSVVIHVEPVPDSQRDAFAAYSQDRLAAVVQSAASVAETDEVEGRRTSSPVAQPVVSWTRSDLQNASLGIAVDGGGQVPSREMRSRSWSDIVGFAGDRRETMRPTRLAPAPKTTPRPVPHDRGRGQQRAPSSFL